MAGTWPAKTEIGFNMIIF